MHWVIRPLTPPPQSSTSTTPNSPRHFFSSPSSPSTSRLPPQPQPTLTFAVASSLERYERSTLGLTSSVPACSQQVGMRKSPEVSVFEQSTIPSPHVMPRERSQSSTTPTSHQLFQHNLAWQQTSPRVVGSVSTHSPQIMNTRVQIEQLQQPPTSASRLEPHVTRENHPSSSDVELSTCRQAL
ncbi:hypothetical protein Clacol_005027 [Clathrus columnatus]|uniref:Uncharacterized protein n=1 Tax=Clathrus columnatus TaxID=1419009 RepID=A0AAV5A853_9AGAM|nr:hypothetical protein Clacol_005027 [Clathrus columnatus]